MDSLAPKTRIPVAVGQVLGALQGAAGAGHIRQGVQGINQDRGDGGGVVVNVGGVCGALCVCAW